MSNFPQLPQINSQLSQIGQSFAEGQKNLQNINLSKQQIEVGKQQIEQNKLAMEINQIAKQAAQQKLAKQQKDQQKEAKTNSVISQGIKEGKNKYEIGEMLADVGDGEGSLRMFASSLKDMTTVLDGVKSAGKLDSNTQKAVLTMLTKNFPQYSKTLLELEKAGIKTKSGTKTFRPVSGPAVTPSVIEAGFRKEHYNYDNSTGELEPTGIANPDAESASKAEARDIRVKQGLSDHDGITREHKRPDGTTLMILPDFKSRIPAEEKAKLMARLPFELKKEVRQNVVKNEFGQAQTAVLEASDAIKMLDENPNIFKLRNAAGRKLGIGDAGKFDNSVKQAILLTVFAQSGKQVTEKELKAFDKIYNPRWFQDEKNARIKLQKMRNIAQLKVDLFLQPSRAVEIIKEIEKRQAELGIKEGNMKTVDLSKNVTEGDDLTTITVRGKKLPKSKGGQVLVSRDGQLGYIDADKIKDTDEVQ